MELHQNENRCPSQHCVCKPRPMIRRHLLWNIVIMGPHKGAVILGVLRVWVIFTWQLYIKVFTKTRTIHGQVLTVSILDHHKIICIYCKGINNAWETVFPHVPGAAAHTCHPCTREIETGNHKFRASLGCIVRTSLREEDHMVMSLSVTECEAGPQGSVAGTRPWYAPTPHSEFKEKEKYLARLGLIVKQQALHMWVTCLWAKPSTFSVTCSQKKDALGFSYNFKLQWPHSEFFLKEEKKN